MVSDQFLIGGSFSNASGVTGPNLSRFNADGSLDGSFDPRPNGAVNTIAVQADGKVLVGGFFSSIAGTTRNRIARFNTDGSLDTAFDPNANGAVDTIVLQSDQKILIGGAFNTLQPNGATSATSRPFAARLNADGTLETFTYRGGTSENLVGAYTDDGGHLNANGRRVVAAAFLQTLAAAAARSIAD